jgi:CheY-like chemotaxis protein
MGKKILVIDDDRMMLRLVTAILARAGYEVTNAATVSEALVSLKNNPVDLVTCDLMMPDISGLDFLKMMKDGAICTVPVVVLTAAGHQAELEKASALGAAFVLSKPFTSQQLLEVVGSHIP